MVLTAAERRAHPSVCEHELPSHDGLVSMLTMVAESLEASRLRIAGVLADGSSFPLLDKQISERLGISESTVRNHWQHIFTRLEASNRTEAVTKALRLGLI